LIKEMDYQPHHYKKNIDLGRKFPSHSSVNFRPS
jgi:hypothetical protein